MNRIPNSGGGDEPPRMPLPPGIFINTPERSPLDAANDPFMLLALEAFNSANTATGAADGMSMPMHDGHAVASEHLNGKVHANGSGLPGLSNGKDHAANGHASHSNGQAPLTAEDVRREERTRNAEQRRIRNIATLLTSLFRDLEMPLTVRLWNGERLHLGQARHDRKPPFELHCNHPRAIRAMASQTDPLRVAEAYCRNDMDVSGDFFAALRLKDHLARMRPTLTQRLSAYVRMLDWSLLQPPAALEREQLELVSAERVKQHSRAANKASIAFHYDLSNGFYALWLDRQMVYSCAYFRNPDDSLEAAQTQKLEHICRKLLIKPGQRLLDVGCGWGALAIHAARHHGAQVHGITLSRQQWEWANRQVRRLGLQAQVQIDLCDYRDIPGENRYDRISSVGMFEHVGLDNLPAYFSTLHRLLKPQGLMLNHGIAHREEGWSNNMASRFINRYVFPDGELDCISNVQRVMERCGFDVSDLENLRQHYALTLRHWVQRLEAHHDEAMQHVDEATWRIWRLYMAASALEFESGELGVYQILARKHGALPGPLPLTRAHLYGAD